MSDQPDYGKARTALTDLRVELRKMGVKPNTSGEGLFRPTLRSLDAFITDHEAESKETPHGD